MDGFLDSKRCLKEFTLTNDLRQIQNQIAEVILSKMPLWRLPKRSGRGMVKE